MSEGLPENDYCLGEDELWHSRNKRRKQPREDAAWSPGTTTSQTTTGRGRLWSGWQIVSEHRGKQFISAKTTRMSEPDPGDTKETTRHFCLSLGASLSYLINCRGYLRGRWGSWVGASIAVTLHPRNYSESFSKTHLQLKVGFGITLQ